MLEKQLLDPTIERLNNGLSTASILSVLPGSTLIYGQTAAISVAASSVITIASSASFLALLTIAILSTEKDYQHLTQTFENTMYEIGRGKRISMRILGHINNGILAASGVFLIGTKLLHWTLLPKTIGGMAIAPAALIGLAATCAYKAIESAVFGIIMSYKIMKLATQRQQEGETEQAIALADCVAHIVALTVERVFAWGALAAGFGVAAGLALGTVAFTNPITAPALLIGLFVFGAALLIYTIFSSRGVGQIASLKKFHKIQDPFTRLFGRFFRGGINKTSYAPIVCDYQGQETPSSHHTALSKE